MHLKWSLIIKDYVYDFFKVFQNSSHRSFQVGRCVCFDIILIKRFFEKVIQYFRSENVTYNGFTKGFMKYFCNTFYSLYRSMLSPSFPYFGCHFNIHIYFTSLKLLSGHQLIITMMVLTWIYIPLAPLTLYAYIVCQTRVQFQMHFKLSTQHKTLSSAFYNILDVEDEEVMMHW